MHKFCDMNAFMYFWFVILLISNVELKFIDATDFLIQDKIFFVLKKSDTH